MFQVGSDPAAMPPSETNNAGTFWPKGKNLLQAWLPLDRVTLLSPNTLLKVAGNISSCQCRIIIGYRISYFMIGSAVPPILSATVMAICFIFFMYLFFWYWHPGIWSNLQALLLPVWYFLLHFEMSPLTTRPWVLWEISICLLTIVCNALTIWEPITTGSTRPHGVDPWICFSFHLIYKPSTEAIHPFGACI